MNSAMERVLILAKTYPSPSAQYIETSCVAGITEHGAMRRLFPVPFRYVAEDRQFKKWQWIDVRVEKAARDHRPESHRIFVDTINCGSVIDTKADWAERRTWLARIPAFDDFAALQAAQERHGTSLALLRPCRLTSLDISKARNTDWTDEEREKLVRDQMQGDLFSEEDARKEVRKLRKIPVDFHYRCVFRSEAGESTARLKIVDWEAGALYWTCRKDYGDEWEAPFRQKLEEQFREKDLMFLMGNLYRFRDQWLIVSLIYPPKRSPHAPEQPSLF